MRWPVSMLLVALAGVLGVSAHALLRSPTEAEAATRRADAATLVGLLGTPDLALSSTSRWLRHPSQTESGAPFADGPARFDTDPAGSFIRPDRALFRTDTPPEHSRPDPSEAR